MDPHPDGKAEAFNWHEARIQHRQRRKYPQAGVDGPLGIVFMRLRIAKIDEQPIAQILGNIPGKALGHGGTGGLIGAHHLAVVFWVELTRCPFHKFATSNPAERL